MRIIRLQFSIGMIGMVRPLIYKAVNKYICKKMKMRIIWW